MQVTISDSALELLRHKGGTVALDLILGVT